MQIFFLSLSLLFIPPSLFRFPIIERPFSIDYFFHHLNSLIVTASFCTCAHFTSSIYRLSEIAYTSEKYKMKNVHIYSWRSIIFDNNIINSMCECHSMIRFFPKELVVKIKGYSSTFSRKSIVMAFFISGQTGSIFLFYRALRLEHFLYLRVSEFPLSMLLLYFLGDDRQIRMISGSNEKLKQ